VKATRRLLGTFLLLAGMLPAGGSLPVHATASSTATLQQARRLVQAVERMQWLYRDLDSFQASFSLQHVSPTFGEDPAETGVLHVAPGGRMLWDYDSPEGQRAVFDGSTWWLFSPEDKTVTRHEVDLAQRNPMIDLLTGEADVLSLFAVGPAQPLTDPLPDPVVLELVPREPRNDVETMEITLSPDTGVLRRVDVTGPLGGHNVLTLGEPQPAPAPAEERFDVTIPDDYVLVEE
jgi:outer membrane lipoprotein-sorting protein